MSWSDIYNDKIKKAGGSQAYIQKKTKGKKALLDQIISYTGNKNTILEAGCGTGALATYLASKGYTVEAIDKDTNMLTIGKDISSFFDKKPLFKQMDIRHTTYQDNTFDVVFSNGVLEHFEDQDIVAILNGQLRVGTYTIFSVPSDYFSEEEKIYGDERLMNSQQWRQIIAQSNGVVIDNFGYHDKGALRNVTSAFPHLLLNHSPYIAFVLESKKTP